MSVESREGSSSAAVAFLQSLRPHQWVKNTLIFIPLLLAGRAGEAGVWLDATLGFAGFTLVASSMYIVNDVRDLASDRLHWSKRNRPLARGDLSVPVALAGAVIGVVAGLALTFTTGLLPVAVLFSYLVLNAAYSVRLRRIPMIDVLTLATLYTLRLLFGVYVAMVALSPWLLVFSMFLFTSLCFAKRHIEVARHNGNGGGGLEGRGYLAEDAPLLFAFGISSAAGAVLIMILYLIEEAFNAEFYSHPDWLWCLPPILFLWLGRVWLLAGRNRLDDDPIRFAVRDRASLALGAAMILVFITAWKL
ncbi:MAG: UbiA family prenyltransferase [Parvibaculaceae bacterium]